MTAAHNVENGKPPTSEQRYGVSPQPPESCPTINKAVSVVEDLVSRIRRYEKADEAELRDMLSDVEYGLGELVSRRAGLLEDIRKANESIRGWGQGWKELALQYAPEPEEESA